MTQQSVSTSWTLSPSLPSSKYIPLFVTLPESSIGVYSRTQHECSSQNYSLFLVPNVWVLPYFLLNPTADLHAQHQQATISIVRAAALPLISSEGNQVKVLLNYSMNNESLLGQRLNAVMGIYDRINGTLIKLSSFPDGFTVNNTAGTIQMASTLTDPRVQNISTIVALTNAEKSEKYSNDVRSDLNVRAILPASLPALNETIPSPPA